MKKYIAVVLSLCAFTTYATTQTIAPAPLVSILTHDNYFNNLKLHCGKAYQGKVTVDNANSTSFANKKLIMHVHSIT